MVQARRVGRTLAARRSRPVGGQLAPNSGQSWDVLGNDGEKLQVKARVVSDPAEPGQLQLSPFRSFAFDLAVIVLLSATDYAVARASKVPRHVIESSAVYRPHVNGKVLFARLETMGLPDARRQSTCHWTRWRIILSTGQSGAPSRTRTCGLLLRRQSLYPPELSGPAATQGRTPYLEHGNATQKSRTKPNW
jgi:hypothetical protein